MQNHQEQELLTDQKCILLKSLIQPVIAFDFDIGLSTTGAWVTPDSPDFHSCQLRILKNRGLRVVTVCWKSKTISAMLASAAGGHDVEVRMTFDMLKSCPI